MTKSLLLIILAIFSFPQILLAADFAEAKKILAKIHKDNNQEVTIYCGCKYSGKKVDLSSCGYRAQKNNSRSERIEWEHIVPISAVANSFSEWRSGSSKCGGKKGRKCAGTNPVFREIEGDMHNLWPEIGELNGLRSNHSMAALNDSEYDFGKCKSKLINKKFEPQLNKGLVARTYLYMEDRYPGHGIVSNKNEKLFEAWNKMHPPSKWECEREKIVAKKQGNRNKFTVEACGK